MRSRAGLLAELARFLWSQKLVWLLPLVALLLVLGGLLLVSNQPVVGRALPLHPLLKRAARWFRERVAPWPGRLALDALYFVVIVPYGLLWRRFRRPEARNGSFWRVAGRVSDSLEKARVRY
jgi:hypothetical protein